MLLGNYINNNIWMQICIHYRHNTFLTLWPPSIKLLQHTIMWPHATLLHDNVLLGSVMSHYCSIQVFLLGIFFSCFLLGYSPRHYYIWHSIVSVKYIIAMIQNWDAECTSSATMTVVILRAVAIRVLSTQVVGSYFYLRSWYLSPDYIFITLISYNLLGQLLGPTKLTDKWEYLTHWKHTFRGWYTNFVMIGNYFFL